MRLWNGHWHAPNRAVCSSVEVKVSTARSASKSVRGHLLTPWCRVLLEQLTGLQLLKKFPALKRKFKQSCRGNVALEKNTLKIVEGLKVQNEFSGETSPLCSIINRIYIIVQYNTNFVKYSDTLANE